MMVLQRPLACLAIVVILMAATVSASVPTGVVTCNEDTFAIQISKAHEANKVQVVDVTIGTGKLVDGTGNADADCTFVGTTSNPGNVASSSGATISQTDISGGASITYGSDTTGTDNKAKCGGTLKDNGDASKIQYTVNVEVVVRETIRTIDRELKYTMPLVCELTKAVAGQTGVQGWVVDRASLVATSATGDTETITFPIDISFHADSSGTAGAALGSTGATVTMGAWVHIRIKETTANALFKFVTKKCWFTGTNDKNSGTKDDFWVDYCPVGKDPLFDDFTEKTNTASQFDIKTKAFFFTGAATTEIFVHCDLFICLTSDADATCTQKSRQGEGGCAMTSRRRRNALPETRVKRSVDNKNNRGWIEHRVVSSEKALLLDRNDVIVPTCGGNFVYDRLARTCSNENLLEISGVYLDLPWNIEYANTSSQTFKDFATGKAYQLYVMTQMVDSSNVILGLEVVSAKEGSVILTIRIKYSAASNGASAFEVFQRAIKHSPEAKRAANVLNIRTEKVIEYVEVKRPSPSSGLNVENLTLIIVIVVLCAAVFISVIAVLKVRQARRGASSNAGSEMKAHDNPNFS